MSTPETRARKVALLLHHYVGIRAEGMILAGAIWCLVGLRAVMGPPAPLIPSVLHLLIPANVTAALWIGTGIAAAALAPFRKASNVGLFLLVVQPGLRTFSYLYAWFAELWPGPPPGDPQGWYAAAVYLAMVLWVVHISRIPADVRAPLSGRRA